MRYLILDTETTGLIPGVHSVLTACLSIHNYDLSIEARLNLKLKFDPLKYEISEKALGVNKINIKEHNETADSWEDCYRKLYYFFKENAPEEGWIARSDTSRGNWLVPTGQNPAFDVNMLKHHFIEGEEERQPLWPVNHQHFDTASIVEFLSRRKAFPEDVRGLKKVCEWIGNIDISKAHTADGDVDMVVDALKVFDKCYIQNEARNQ